MRYYTCTPAVGKWKVEQYSVWAESVKMKKLLFPNIEFKLGWEGIISLSLTGFPKVDPLKRSLLATLLLKIMIFYIKKKMLANPLLTKYFSS